VDDSPRGINLKIDKFDILDIINKIREEIGHKKSELDILDVRIDEKTGDMLILTPDRPEKSAVIGKGGWVVGLLREELGVNSIHVEAKSDFLVPKCHIELAIKKLGKIIPLYDSFERTALLNMSNFLKTRLESFYNLKLILNEFQDIDKGLDKPFKSVVALSGGVDSSFSLILAKKLGFNPQAVTVNPGDFILPYFLKDNIETLTRKLAVEHKYLDADMQEVIGNSLEGHYHPCGRCSKIIEKLILDYTNEIKAPFLIYGDLLSTGAESLIIEREILRINLPALISANKWEIKSISAQWGIENRPGYGCPLLGEVHNRYPHMRRYSIQRVLRETRAGVLEPGEALEQIMYM
jgi:uncharacterized protein